MKGAEDDFRKEGDAKQLYQAYDPEKAKELLRNTDIKVIAISEMVGYLNSSYFCLLFKNYTGMTPARYREEAAC